MSLVLLLFNIFVRLLRVGVLVCVSVALGCMYTCDMHMYVCMCVCIYIYIHTLHTYRSYIYTYIHTYIHTDRHTYIHTYVTCHIHIHTQTNIRGLQNSRHLFPPKPSNNPMYTPLRPSLLARAPTISQRAVTHKWRAYSSRRRQIAATRDRRA
jgi:hypothetical protein